MADQRDGGRFTPGHAGLLGAGRPRGARTKLGEAFLEALLRDFNAADADGQPQGLRAIERTRVDDPATYCRIIGSLLPKQLTNEDGSALVINLISGVPRPPDE